ncbi:MarR family transcriptional regulator, partial [Streptomyces sp. SID5926]|nr:MarR family transcriptional regulator [Streptomyces sp. SID5926]
MHNALMDTSPEGPDDLIVAVEQMIR